MASKLDYEGSSHGSSPRREERHRQRNEASEIKLAAVRAAREVEQARRLQEDDAFRLEEEALLKSATSDGEESLETGILRQRVTQMEKAARRQEEAAHKQAAEMAELRKMLSRLQLLVPGAQMQTSAVSSAQVQENIVNAEEEAVHAKGSPKPVVRMVPDVPPVRSATRGDVSDDEEIAGYTEDEEIKQANKDMKRVPSGRRDSHVFNSMFGGQGDRFVCETPSSRASLDPQTLDPGKVSARGLEPMWEKNGSGFVPMGANTNVPPPKASGEFMLKHSVDSQGRLDLTVMDVLAWIRLHQSKLSQCYYPLHEYVAQTLLIQLENTLRRKIPASLADNLAGCLVPTAMTNWQLNLVLQLLVRPTNEKEFVIRMMECATLVREKVCLAFEDQELLYQQHLNSLVSFQRSFAFLSLNGGDEFQPVDMGFTDEYSDLGLDDKKEPRGVGALICKFIHPAKVQKFKQHFFRRASDVPEWPYYKSQLKKMTVNSMVEAFLTIVDFYHEGQRKYLQLKQSYEGTMSMKPGGRLDWDKAQEPREKEDPPVVRRLRMILEAGDTTVEDMAEAALEDIAQVATWSKEDDSFEADCDGLYNMAVTNRLLEGAERKTGCYKALYDEKESCSKLPDCLFSHDKDAIDVALVQMLRRLLQVKAYRRSVERGLLKELVISPEFLKAHPEPVRPPPRPVARPGQQPVRYDERKPPVRFEERKTSFISPPNRLLARPAPIPRGRDCRYIAHESDALGEDRDFDQDEEDELELQYLAGKEMAKQANAQAPLGQQAEEEDDHQKAFQMQDAPEVVEERIRAMSVGPLLQVRLHRRDNGALLLPETVTCLLDSGATVSYIQRRLVETFRNILGQDDVVTSRNVIKFGSGKPQLATELVVLRIRGDYQGLQVDESLPFIILDTSEFQVIVGWRDIVRKDVIKHVLHQMLGDAGAERALGARPGSLRYMKADMQNRRQRQVDDDWDPEMPELVLMPEHRVEGGDGADPGAVQQAVWDQHLAAANAGEMFTEAVLEQAWVDVQQGHLDWLTIAAVFERWRRNVGADHDWEPMEPLMSRWQRNRAAGRWINNDGPQADGGFRLFMLQSDESDKPIPKRRRDTTVAVQTDATLLLPTAAITRGTSPFARVPDIYIPQPGPPDPIFESYRQLRESLSEYMIVWPGHGDPVEHEVMGLPEFFSLLRLDMADFECFNLYIRLYRTFLSVGYRLACEGVPRGGVHGSNIVQQVNGRWLWRFRRDARNGTSRWLYMAFWWDYMYHEYGAAYMQVLGQYHTLLPPLQHLQGWVSMPEQAYSRGFSGMPPGRNMALPAPVLDTAQLRSSFQAPVQATVQATVQAPVQPVVQALSPVPVQVAAPACVAKKPQLVRSIASNPKKRIRESGSSEFLSDDTFTEWPVSDKRPNERELPTGMSRRWKKIKGTPAENHPSVFVLIGPDKEVRKTLMARLLDHVVNGGSVSEH